MPVCIKDGCEGIPEVGPPLKIEHNLSVYNSVSFGLSSTVFGSDCSDGLGLFEMPRRLEGTRLLNDDWISEYNALGAVYRAGRLSESSGSMIGWRFGSSMY